MACHGCGHSRAGSGSATSRARTPTYARNSTRSVLPAFMSDASNAASSGRQDRVELEGGVRELAPAATGVVPQRGRADKLELVLGERVATHGVSLQLGVALVEAERREQVLRAGVSHAEQRPHRLGRPGRPGTRDPPCGRFEHLTQLVTGQDAEVSHLLERGDDALVEVDGTTWGADESSGPVGDQELPRIRRPARGPNRLEEFAVGV